MMNTWISILKQLHVFLTVTMHVSGTLTAAGSTFARLQDTILRPLAKNSAMLGAEAAKASVNLPTESLKMALVVFIVVPITFAYPFFQRYIVAGLTIGSVKG